MRVHSVDMYRGIIVIMMVIYHYFAIQFVLNGVDVWIYDSRIGLWFGHFVRISFLLLVGISTQLLIDCSKNFPKYQLKRFFKVALAAVLVSIVTFLVIPNSFVLWGVLHLISFAILCLMFAKYLNKKTWTLLAICILTIGFLIEGRLNSFQSIFIPFGFYPQNFSTVDYFPIFPWAGVVFLGYGLSDYLLKLFKLFTLRVGLLEWIGKKALWVYIIHVPILYVVVNYLL